MSSIPRLLLSCGALVAPVFYGVFAGLALVSPGFHLEKHSISALSLGDLGWIQRVNFLVSGALTFLGALGLARSWRGTRGGITAPVLVAVLGLGLVVSGLFSTDPAMGFPQGAPDGLPAAFSTSAQIHSLGFSTAFTALTAAALVAAWRFFGEGRGGRAWACLVVGLVTPLLIALGMTLFARVAGLAFAAAGLVGLGWLSFVLWSLRTPPQGA